MTQSKALALSIIIPAYNEQRHIGACLEAIANQTSMPVEVLLVDNNCTDDTVAIARHYPFVKILHEPKQGLIAARNLGFNKAKGNLLARVDADAQLQVNWVERVLENFQDPELDGLTGLAVGAVIPRQTWLMSTIWARAYFLYTNGYFGVPVLWGANMVLRRSAWEAVKDDACTDESKVHEDQDLSLLVIGNGGRIKQDTHLRIVTHDQSANYWPKYVYYTKLRWATKRHHDQLGTLQKPGLQRIGLGGKVVGFMVRYGLGVIFVIFSLVSWPLDAYMLRRNPEWLR